ncbi:hypothetical protein FS837_012661 [Tulasnella sp. UAMH 9824]|nr:hypothetical protein FS837_012661 [Tulasnella sp. UAMH 9824]
MPINEELVIDVADRIRDILDDYPAGPAILREILQNTDDAGGRVQRFILDSRQHSLEGLLDPLLEECQGPAIIAYNDASFKPQDWIAIRSISNSSKKGDERSTGKFGLGFCTCYHVTDYPQVLSGDKLLILDPHKNIKSSSGCIAFSTRHSGTESDRETYTAHFEGFKGILSPDSDTFDGTAIRLPLRLPSSKSRINPTPMSVEAVRELFDSFIKNDLPEVMLFLKHVTSIELSEISSDGTLTVYAIVQINNADEIIGERSRSRGRSTHAETSHYELEVSMKSDPDSPTSTSYTRRWIITHYVDSFSIASDAMAKRLDQVENPDRVEAMMIADKLFPHVALAFPVPNATVSPIETFSGRLFTLLPLPIITHFPLHIHATLSLTSSRQNLRNADETVMDPKGRLRVEWNRLIFTQFVPEAWVSLMKYLVSTAQDFDVFDIWPSSSIIRDGGYGYWPRLPYLVLKEAATRDVWPLWSKESSRHQLASVVVTLNDNDPNLLPALVSCNVPVVVVPPNVLADISASEFKDTILSPATAVPFLRVNSKTLSSLPSIAIKSICDYLVTAGDVNLIFNLPIIPNVQSTHTSISPNLVYTIANESEASLFHVVDPNLLAGNGMSSSTLELLITQSEGRIHTLEPKDVVLYLKKRIGGLGGPKVASVAVNPSVHQWLVEFWAWLDGWARRIELVKDEANWKAIAGMYALPLRTANDQPAARLAGGLAIHPALAQEEVLSTLVALEVPVLASPFSNGPNIMLVSPPASDVKFILRNLPKRKTLPHLDQATRRVLKNFLVGHLSYLLLSHHSTSPLLDSECRAALRSLPIFPLLPPGRRNSEDVAFDTAPEGSLFVARSVPVIPNIRRAHFIDYDRAMPLCQALEVEVLDEIAVLKIAMTRDVWTHLQPDLVPALIDRLIWRLPDFDAPMRRLFSGLEIIDVGDQGPRKSPNSVIDPASSLAGLFDPEDEVLPAGKFAIDEQGSYIQRLRNNNMLQTTLTDAMVEERIDKIVALSEEGEPDRGRRKALRLLSLLDKRSKEQIFSTQSPELMETLHQRAWIPSGDQIYKLSDLWDSRATDTLLCDWALHILPIEISSSSFRISIGWDVVPFDVLRRQLLEVTGGCLDCQVNATEEISGRIKAVLKTLAARLMDGLCTDEEIQHLADELGDAEWVPISEGRRMKARRTWLPTDLKSAHRHLGSRFFPVAETLLKEDGMKDLLTCMGIPERPSHADLYASQLEILSELLQLGAEDNARNDLIRASIELALEMCRNRNPEELSQLPLLVPTESGTLVEAENVLYNDMEMDAQRLQDGTQFAHPLLSQASAKALGLQTYRGRQLSELESADDDNGFYIGEDITTRIKSVLLDYTIDHSFNEWVANAADAGATCLKLLVDESTFVGREVIPTKSEFPPGPALVIYNDGLFSEEDFRGIGNIGEGGKALKSGTIGRFGLGALSFYHFTELPMIVSGNSVLLLDPSRQHLHLRRSRGIRITLDVCQQRWPDQLKPLEGIFDFFAHKGYYNGTLFRLPLRTVAQAELSSLSNKHFTPLVLFNITRGFYTSASRSLFFTSLREISTYRRGPDKIVTPIWSVTGSRTTLRTGEGVNSLSATEVTVSGRELEMDESVDERWLVTRSWGSNDAFPLEVRRLAVRHRLSNLQPNFGLAFSLTSNEYTSKSCLFATLPLPVSIALPVHLHATWILAPDRRSIRNDTSVQGNDVPLDSQYNRHILQHFIPALYLQTLAYINEHYPHLIHLAWPQRGKDDGEVMVAAALYRQLPRVPDLVLRTASGKRVSPKNAIVHLKDTPDAVKKLLNRLPLPSYVAEPHFDTSFFKDWENLHGDSPAVVARILRRSVAAVQNLFGGDSPALTIKDLQSIVEYLLDENESLVGIPLLPLANGKVVTFEKSNQYRARVFVRDRERIEKLFGPHRVLNPEIDFETGVCWSKSGNLNLDQYRIIFDIRNILGTANPPITPRQQHKVTADQLQWTRELLVYLVEQGLKWDDVSDLPLVPTMNGDLTVSLDHAKNGNVWICVAGGESPITKIFLQLQIPVINLRLDRSLPLKGWTTTSETLHTVLKLLQRFDHGTAAILDRVSLDDWARFTTRMRLWIRENTLYSLEEDPTFLDTLVNLPLFDGWQGRQPCRFVPCSKLAMLPIRENIQKIAHFFPPNMIVTGQTSDLEAILSRKAPAKILSFAKFFSYLNIPRSQLPENLHASLRIIINLVIERYKGHYPDPLIPDEDGIPKSPNELYDHRVEFYALQFKGRRDLFVHSAFHDLMDGMIPLGIRHKFDSKDLQAFIETVDKDANNGQDVMERATWVWRYINDSPLTMGGIDYGMIRERRFIPRRSTQYSPDPTLSQYTPTLEMVVSPDDVHLDEHAPLLWTQRAPFELAPSATLKRIYPEIGRPTVEHVVHHLRNLSTYIATHELQSETLFHEIQHIYEWLRMNQKEVQQYLDLISPHPVWLNIDSMDSPWTWCTANQLVFDLTHDTKRSFRAKQFLCDYRELLIAAGAQKRRYDTIDQQQPETSHSEKGLAGWRELRRREILFDIWFKPEGFVIGAHRGLLAALIPHFAQAVGDDSSNSLTTSPVEYPLPDATSAFAVRAVIDYVYTGVFSCTPPAQHDDVPLVLEQLLNLLKLAHLWGVLDLQAQTVAAISELKLVDEDNCDLVLQQAETYGSTTLAQYCIRTKELNGWI